MADAAQEARGKEIFYATDDALADISAMHGASIWLLPHAHSGPSHSSIHMQMAAVVGSASSGALHILILFCYAAERLGFYVLLLSGSETSIGQVKLESRACRCAVAAVQEAWPQREVRSPCLQINAHQCCIPPTTFYRGSFVSCMGFVKHS